MSDSKLGNYWYAAKNWWHSDGRRDPMKAIAEISVLAEKVFLQAFSNDCSGLPEEPAFHHRFAGLVMLADWIGSHQYWFPIIQEDFDERFKRNRTIIPELLRTMGLDTESLRPPLQAKGSSFRERFGFPPRPLQQGVDELLPEQQASQLVIAESETGSGKTEAALNWFAKLFTEGKVDGMNFALPTRVAARDLYERINMYVSKWYSNSQERPVTLLAVPGYAQVNGHHPKILAPDTAGKLL